MIKQTAATPHLQKLLKAFFVAVIFVTAYGYTFNGGDQEEVLPYVYKLGNAALYPNDYLVPHQVSHCTIRYYIAQVIYGCSFFVPVSVAVAVLYFLFLSLAAYAIGEISEMLSGRQDVFLFAPLVVLVLLNKCTIGGNALEDPQLSGSVFSIAFSLLGIRAALRNQPVLAGICIGCGTLFQLLFGIDALLLAFLLLFFISARHSLSAVLKTGLAFSAIAAFILVPIGLRQLEAGGQESPLYGAIMFHYRMPHHYLWCAFPRKDVVASVGLWSVAILLRNKVQKTTFRFYQVALLLTLVYIVTDALFFQWMEVVAVAKLQLFKMTVWCTIAAGLVVVEALVSLPFISQLAGWGSKCSTATVFAVSLAILCLLSCTVWWPEGIPGRSKYQLGAYPKDDLTRMHEWIGMHTPVNAVVLPPPDDESFLCQARRSVPVAWKGLIHEPAFMFDWYNRFRDVYGVALIGQSCGEQVKERALATYPLRPDSLVVSPVNIGYRIWDESTANPALLAGKPVLFRSGNYLLLPFMGGK